ncbi:uncharacterized protein TNIN_155551 [Trichonephila inaurata madagascariensis]|uniref:Uncharacterized protein n=1 Tax=Trichonephila inaurata madagascariensis TaxID=2747483 RepID=A0A8X6YY63_9ARAC|nr:uncharacterized protein TNIN_155551 [Trichonephila inaurata madagascariensis]
MAYLGKGRKSDLSYIAEQLGERVIDDLKIIDLRNLIVNSTNYDEEFVREMLNARIEERLEGENVWVQHILDEHMTCLPLAEVEIDCEWGHIITKAAVVRKQLDQGRYILGNRTIELLESDLEHNSLPRRKIVNAIQTRSQRKKRN